MGKASLISEMQKLRFGSEIFCSDGEYGNLVDVIIDPATRSITHIGVRRGRLFGRTSHLPFDAVTSADSNAVRLRVTLADVAAAVNVAAGGALLDARSVVELGGAAASGMLTLVAVHPQSGELAYIVAHHLRPGQDTMLREEYVTTLAPGRVSATIPETALATLPPYRSDGELLQAVEAILFDVTPLHVDRKGMTLRVLDGVLYLDGNISSTLRADMVRDQVMGVPGLLEIKNNLVGDDQLASDVAMALGRDPRTRDLSIGVYPRLGVVRLSGAVHTSQQKAAAEEIIRGLPSVRSVSNELTVDPRSAMLHVMSSTGVETEDQIPGKYTRHTK